MRFGMQRSRAYGAPLSTKDSRLTESKNSENSTPFEEQIGGRLEKPLALIRHHNASNTTYAKSWSSRKSRRSITVSRKILESDAGLQPLESFLKSPPIGAKLSTAKRQSERANAGTNAGTALSVGET